MNKKLLKRIPIREVHIENGVHVHIGNILQLHATWHFSISSCGCNFDFFFIIDCDHLCPYSSVAIRR